MSAHTLWLRLICDCFFGFVQDNSFSLGFKRYCSNFFTRPFTSFVKEIWTFIGYCVRLHYLSGSNQTSFTQLDLLLLSLSRLLCIENVPIIKNEVYEIQHCPISRRTYAAPFGRPATWLELKLLTIMASSVVLVGT